MKKLTSVQRRILSEQEMAPEMPKMQPQAQPQGPAPKPAAAAPAPEPAPKAPMPEEGQGDAPMGPSEEAGRVKSALKAVEKLQKAAADLEAARFTMQQEYSDFTLARKLDVIKQELVGVISKAKEHISQSAAKSPDAKQEMSKWLGL